MSVHIDIWGKEHLDEEDRTRIQKRGSLILVFVLYPAVTSSFEAVSAKRSQTKCGAESVSNPRDSGRP